MKKTALYKYHIEQGAKIVSFAGYHMPVVYESGIREEYFSVRKSVGIFDVSHMGKIRLSGNDIFVFLQKILSNNIDQLKVGDAQYNVICNENGGIIDDLILYKEKQSYLLIVNASNTKKVNDWLSKYKTKNLLLEDLSDRYSLVALQGPESRKLLEKILEKKIVNKFYSFINDTFLNEKIVISRTGYTGELGYEILGKHKIIKLLWKKCIALGAIPCGLASRDILRLEMKYCLHGNEIDININPIQANLNWIVDMNKENFIGKDAINREQMKNNKSKLIAFKMLERGIPRTGYNIYIDNKLVGKVTSGTHSPSLNIGIGLGYIKENYINDKQKIQIEIREKRYNGIIFNKPFINNNSLFN